MRPSFFLLALSFFFIFGETISNSQQHKESSTHLSPTGSGGNETLSAEAKPTFDVNQQTDKVVAKINGRPVRQSDLMGRDLNDYIDHEIVYLEGINRGFDKDPETRKLVENYEKKLVLAKMIEELYKTHLNPADITDEEINGYYEANKDRFTLAVTNSITVRNRKMASEVLQRIADGEDFTAVASEFPEDSSKPVRRRAGFTRAYNHHFNKMEVGELSRIIREGRSFKIFQITQVRVMSLRGVRNDIINSLLQNKKLSLVENYADELKKKDHINVELIK